MSEEPAEVPPPAESAEASPEPAEKESPPAEAAAAETEPPAESQPSEATENVPPPEPADAEPKPEEEAEKPVAKETPEPEESQPTEPHPAESPPTEPQPTEPHPAEPQPTEPQPTEPQPAEPQPTEPEPAEHKPEEPKTEEPTEEKKEEPQPDEGKAEEAKPEKVSKEDLKRESGVIEEPSVTKKSLVIEEKASKASQEGSKVSVSIKKKSSHFDGTMEGESSSATFRKTDDGRDPERKASKAQKVIGSIISIRRLSTIGEYFDRKGARFMNTYKLESDNPFNPDKVHKILENVMVEALENLTYDPDKCPKQAKWASSAIRAKVKELQFDRYKLICLVTIGEKTSQDLLVTCRFLWDADRDRYAAYSIENTYVFGIAICFGLYYE